MNIKIKQFCKGFTILELVISIAIFAIMSALLCIDIGLDRLDLAWFH